MSAKVIGVGWAKTGTTTLGACLTELGFDHVGLRLDLVDRLESGDVDAVVEELGRRDSCEDWPWPLLYREIDERFPGSRFVLTTRPPEPWLRSYRNMVSGEAPSARVRRRRTVIYGFDPATADDDELVTRVTDHNESVRRYFADRPGDLLEIDWSRGDGWPELCGFLGLEEPGTPVPRANAGDYRPARWRRMRSRVRAAARQALFPAR